jgi:maleate isomerase
MQTRAAEFDQGRHSRGKIGFVLLQTEQTIEDDMFAIIPRTVGVHFSRVAIPNTINVATLGRMVDGLAEGARMIIPDAKLDVICYACTSGSIVIGEEQVVAELKAGAPGAVATTLITGVVRALRAFGAQKIVVGTPYLDEINELERTFLIEKGFEVLELRGLSIALDSDMVRVSPRFLLDFAESLDCKDADAIFISCGALRSVEIIEELERRVNKPVVVSNQAMAWDTMRLAGVADSVSGFGRLLREH